jgi:hypothetical protein
MPVRPSGGSCQRGGRGSGATGKPVLANWASTLVSEHDRTGGRGCSRRPVAWAGQAIDTAEPGTLQRSDALSALAGVLIREYQDTGSLPAINRQSRRCASPSP